jgi:pyruvate/2-oxoglutarate dehydrogenase complex dihydrolipoamide dehydrogenase (E3) component
MGGDCLNVGCVPSKAILRAARAWADARNAAERFGAPAVSGDGDFGAAMVRMRRLRAGLSTVDSAERFRGLGVDVFLGEGRFTSPDQLAVAGQTLRFRRAVLATGGRAGIPPVPGLAEVGCHTNETIFSLTERPKRLVVIGAGPMGCELAQAFARFGTQVELLDEAERVLPREDAEAGRLVAAALERDGVVLRLGVRLVAAARRGEERVITIERGGHRDEVAGDAVLVAAGRLPNIEGIGLEAARIATGARGVQVDDRMRTTNRRVYAIGDVASRYHFTHAADAQARLVVANALFFGIGGGKASSLAMPWCTYTSPEVARVGLSAEEAASAGAAVEAIRVPLREIDRAVLEGETEGYLEVLLAPGSDRVLGATLVAEHAGELIIELTAAMTHRIGLARLGRTIHPYPTRGEVVRKAADAWNRSRLTPRARRVLAAYFRLVR